MSNVSAGTDLNIQSRMLMFMCNSGVSFRCVHKSGTHKMGITKMTCFILPFISLVLHTYGMWIVCANVPIYLNFQSFFIYLTK